MILNNYTAIVKVKLNNVVHTETYLFNDMDNRNLEVILYKDKDNKVIIPKADLIYMEVKKNVPAI